MERRHGPYFEPTAYIKLFDGSQLTDVRIEKHSGEVFELRTQIDRCVQMSARGRASANGRDGLWSAALCLLAEESIRQKRALPVGKLMP
jgi:myo-inositol 2-dehydrogenase/D-chiro-inositol 1-dehydrogenase